MSQKQKLRIRKEIVVFALLLGAAFGVYRVFFYRAPLSKAEIGAIGLALGADFPEKLYGCNTRFTSAWSGITRESSGHLAVLIECDADAALRMFPSQWSPLSPLESAPNLDTEGVWWYREESVQPGDLWYEGPEATAFLRIKGERATVCLWRSAKYEGFPEALVSILCRYWRTELFLLGPESPSTYERRWP